jgi:hypothetical protein
MEHLDEVVRADRMLNICGGMALNVAGLQARPH